MQSYRLYCLNEAGHFFRCDEFNAADDAAASAEARERQGESAAELWCGARMVTSFKVPAHSDGGRRG
jgi:hypothetical protein